MIRVKICGLREPEHVEAALAAGADLLGFVFYPPVRRYVEPLRVRDLVAALPRGRAELVGVFVNESPERMNEIADLVGLDLIQLSGDEPAELSQALGRPVIRTVHVDGSTEPDAVAARAAGARIVHLDTRRTGAYGGTGERFDWRVARRAAAVGPVLLAGGLDAANVGEAIRTAAPWGVDVSSGVERDGRKDSAKIHAFVAAARAAAEEKSHQP